MKYIIILCTINDLDKAKEISQNLLLNKLVACVNILPSVTSIYCWQGKICEDNEYMMVIKSRSDLFEDVKNAILALHPYDVPEVISIEINDGAKPYLDWLDAELK